MFPPSGRLVTTGAALLRSDYDEGSLHERGIPRVYVGPELDTGDIHGPLAEEGRGVQRIRGDHEPQVAASRLDDPEGEVHDPLRAIHDPRRTAGAEAGAAGIDAVFDPGAGLTCEGAAQAG